MNLSDDHIRILSALRAATVLRRAPGTLTPDGHEHWWKLGELEMEGRLDIGPHTNAAARGLRKHGLVAGRTSFTVTRYAITGEGLLALAGYEAEHGRSDVAAAEMDLDQAREDGRQARARERAAADRLALTLAEMNEAKRSRQS
jgi:hypothetical protein